MRVHDNLLRDTEDGGVTWSKERQGEMNPSGAVAERTVYVAETPEGKLLLRGRDDGRQWFSSVPFPKVVEPATRGEARLYLYTEDGRASLFPPVPTSALQPILDDLLTVVRFRVEGPRAQEFARRFLGEA